MRLAAATTLTIVVLTVAPLLADEPKAVRFETEDGLTIAADFWPIDGRQAPVVILLHMYKSNRQAWRPLMETLHAGGIAVLAIDLRGHGDSTGTPSMSLAQRVDNRDVALFRSMYRDVLGAYAWLSGRPDVDLSRFGLVGASIGCSVAIDYAARDRSVDVVVCMTPGENYLGVDSRRHIAEYVKNGERPILLLATQAERTACDALAKIATSAGVDIVGQGRVHGTRMFGQIEGIEEKIVGFLGKGIRSEPATEVAAAVDGDVYFDVGSAMDLKLDPGRVRLFSSAAEAEARGLKRAEGPQALIIEDGVE